MKAMRKIGLTLATAFVLVAAQALVPSNDAFRAVTAAHAQNATCAVQAGDKKLAGAAKTSFVKKCCETQAAEKKLAGAAKTSFTTKCEKDAGG